MEHVNARMAAFVGWTKAGTLRPQLNRNPLTVPSKEGTKQSKNLRLLRPCLGALPRNDSLSELVLLIQQHTRQFAKRQLTWFRREKNIRWIHWAERETPIFVCDKIMSEING